MGFITASKSDILSPKLTSFNKALKSPIWTCEFTTPNSNSSLYAASNSASLNLVFFKLPTPDICQPSLKAFPKATGSLVKNIPFAAANAPALIMLRKCVGIERTVLANWEAALGNNNKFLYKKLAPFSAIVDPSLPLTAAV